MINIADIISRLQTTTSFNVDYARAKEPSLQDVTIPLIYVGYGSIRTELADKVMDFNEFNFAGEGMLQVIEIQIVCSITSFYDTFRTVYKALNGFNPVGGGEEQRTALSYEQGGVMGIDNGNLWHLDRYRIGFSTQSTDF